MKEIETEAQKRGKRRKAIEKILIVLLVLCCVNVVIFAAFTVVKNYGKKSLKEHADKIANEELVSGLNDAFETAELQPQLEEGQILVNGQVYQFNEDIMTFLCMGIDSRNGIAKEKTPGKAGQADAILLIVVNPHKENINVIAINRDTMTEVEIYDTEGIHIGEEYKQLAIQYAYGNGREKSCELMEGAVSNLFYGIPIHAYGALDMQSIALLNDAVGGVEITVAEDMTRFKRQWTEGTQVHLSGEEALLYVAKRDTTKEGSNFGRIERQKQYLTKYVEKLKLKIKQDITFPLTLYNMLQEHIVTSLKLEEITYLADTLMGYDFSMEDVISLKGEWHMGDKNEELILDEEALRQLVIDVFYEKVA